MGPEVPIKNKLSGAGDQETTFRRQFLQGRRKKSSVNQESRGWAKRKRTLKWDLTPRIIRFTFICPKNQRKQKHRVQNNKWYKLLLKSTLKGAFSIGGGGMQNLVPEHVPWMRCLLWTIVVFLIHWLVLWQGTHQPTVVCDNLANTKTFYLSRWVKRKQDGRM